MKNPKNKRRVIDIRAKYGTFKTIFEWDKSVGGSWFVDAPSLQGAYTSGKTLAEAKRMAREVINLICEELIEDNNIIIDDKNMAIGRIPQSRVISMR